MYAVLTNSLLALVTAFALAAALCPALIPMLYSLSEGNKLTGNSIRSRLRGRPAPVMGGIAILFAVIVTTLVWGRDSYSFVLVALLMSGAFALIGFADDFIRTVGNGKTGLRLWQMIAAQVIVSFGFAIWLYNLESVGSTLWLGKVRLGIFFIPYAMLVILATLNAVSLTDSFAGLSGSVTSIYALFMSALLCMTVTTSASPAEFQLLRDQSALSVFSMSVAGGCLGLLIYNLQPSRLGLGKTGTLLLGGAIAAIALMSRTSLLLPLMGMCFTASIISAVWHTVSGLMDKQKKDSDRGLVHDQLKKRGLPESKIVSIYGIATVICSAGALLIYWFLK